MIGCSEKPTRYTRFILYMLFLFQFLTSFRPQELAWDGIYYYAFARSVVFDGDLHLQNDMQLAYQVTPAHDFAAAHPESDLTPTGRVDSPFAIGTAVLWLPWMALIYAIARGASLIGLAPAPLTGYEWPFVWGMATATCLYGWVSILTAYRLARKVTGEKAALIAAATLALSTPLWYYQFREPFYAHAASAMATAIFVFAWWQLDKQPPKLLPAFLLGALGGLSILTRWQNATYLILPTITMGRAALAALQENDRPTLSRSLMSVLATLGGAALVVTPQLAVWNVFYGRPFLVPQGGAFINWRAPWLQQVVLSPFHGLIPWMPLVVPALAGLILLARRAPHRGIPLVVAILLQVYVNSCAQDWFAGGGYGARRFTNTLVILLVGTAYLIDRCGKRWRVPVLALSALLVLHQFLLLRYGFAEQIGGHVVSMGPDYTWHAESMMTFLQRLAGYAPRVVQHPLESLAMPGSPLAIARDAPWTVARQMLLLFCGSGLAAITAAGTQRLTRCPQKQILTGMIVILVLLADVWILCGS